MISDKLKEYSAIAQSENAKLLDLSDNIAAIVFNDKENRMDSKTAGWIIEELSKIENDINGLLIMSEGNDFCNGTRIASCGNIDDNIASLQKLTNKIKMFSKPVVAILNGNVMGIGYDIAKNSHCAIAYPDLENAGYNLKNEFPVGGLTTHVIETYSVGENVMGHDIMPFLKTLMNKICFPKKAESVEELISKGILPSNTIVIAHDDNIIQVGKNKAISMFREGFKPYTQKEVAVQGTVGQAALGVVLINMYEGEFISKDIYEKAFKIVEVICGGNVPKGTLVSEKQLLKLEMDAYKSNIKETNKEKEVTA
jgi:3-hydroxyacyl-CoA dehydrogenase